MNCPLSPVTCNPATITAPISRQVRSGRSFRLLLFSSHASFLIGRLNYYDNELDNDSDNDEIPGLRPDANLEIGTHEECIPP